jgi:hypothetical protein
MTIKISKHQALSKYYADNEWRTNKINLAYIRDADPDTFKPTGLQPDKFNCVRIIWSEEDLIMNAAATTRPGVAAIHDRMNKNGTFSIKHDHFHKNGWQVGRHITGSSNQLSLIQVNTLVGTRDNNENYMTSDDRVFTDVSGANHHTTFNNSSQKTPPSRIGKWSYGCLVGQWAITHYRCMDILQDSGIKLFDCPVIYSGTFDKWLKDNDLELI